MLESSARRIMARLADSDVVLDIGGWGKPFPRADWVIDHMPYETRGMYGYETHDPERFTASTWIQRDVCDREPFPFEDNSIDFVICSHTLEDIRDPIWVCSEIRRIGKAGYIETPSRLEEQCFGVQGPWVGWSHHRWLVGVEDEALEFVFKHHVVCGRTSDHFPVAFEGVLSPDERVVQVWWEGSFDFHERIFIQADELDPYLADFVATEMARRPMPTPRWGQRFLERALGPSASRRRRAIRRLAEAAA